MEALAKIGAACSSLLQYYSDELESLVTPEAYCNFSSQEFSAVQVVCRLFRVRYYLPMRTDNQYSQVNFPTYFLPLIS
ncbi:hypothetical protein CUMW_247640 [Citrus unshiu]|uniref:Uncharacterized protein n=1 Tax=Citrus unshiu TaxID=55188 RepID=A0A2H5QNY5_CITUN|nr:hypothetical protein CUMW_247640 [Citrus unshiu]